MPTISRPSFDDECDTPLLYPTIPLHTFANVSTPQQQVEDGSWDTDDEEERIRVPPPSGCPSNLLLDAQDDPTLVYCDRALQGTMGLLCDS
jgi:hypothetical protein